MKKIKIAINRVENFKIEYKKQKKYIYTLVCKIRVTPKKIS